VFRAEAKGQPLVLDNAGVVEGNEVFKDRATGSRWQQSSLRAISSSIPSCLPAGVSGGVFIPTRKC
jgi:hypothetical protein